MEKLGITEYEEVLLDNISKVIVTRNYIEQNQGFWNSIVFKLFEEYYYSHETVSIRSQARSVEIFFNSFFIHKPSTERGEDILSV